MPTYHAIGVTAGLAICDLESTLTTNILRTMGPECKKEHQRVQQVFSCARGFLERPIGEDGSDRGVIRFIGVDQDMPVYVVETGEKLRTVPMQDDDDEAALDARIPKIASQGLLDSTESPLTSLGDTPVQSSFNWSPVKIPTKQTVHSSAESSPYAYGASFAGRLATLQDDQAEKALILSIDLSSNAFLPDSDSASTKAKYKDLKIEVFVNGELVDVAFLSCRAATSSTTLRFSGTRVHRQVEKPWIYSNLDSAFYQSSSYNSRLRWQTISLALAEEAERRGRNKFGRMSPSAEFLSAISTLDFPERLNRSKGMAIIDVLITSGKGRKYGAETSYIMDPTRMDDHSYTASISEPLGFDMEAGFTTEHTLESFLEEQCSPDVHRFDSASPSPPKKTRLELEAELGIAKYKEKFLLGSYETANGQPGKRQRTLRQRLADIGKMSPSNQANEMAKLKAELRSNTEETMVKKSKITDNHAEEGLDASPPTYATSLEAASHIMTIDDPFVDAPHNEKPPAAEEVHTMSPTDMFKQWPQHIEQPPLAIDPALTAEPGAVLTQNRIDTALEAGAHSNGPLLRLIAASSPVHTPPRKTPASSLAHSPARVPVKPQTCPGPPKTPTPKRRHSLLDNQDSALTSMPEFDIAAAANNITPTKRAGTTTPSRSGRGVDRTAKAWDPHERTIADAVANFKPSAIFDGSCVGYAEDAGAQRQIGKARAGRFQEESVVVGMRFVVL